ncbi:MAG TPA: hypothetical protein PLV92_29135, partial [Pirellulaceae bacterium]|nr:hypothetical protein [Pirellulaceae bacterium]
EQAMVEARQLWSDAGLDAQQSARLLATRVSFADLPFNTVGFVDFGNEGEPVIKIDVGGNGHGWFIDPTPMSNEEFAVDETSGSLTALTGSEAFGHYDLVSVLAHEMGHILGLGDMAVDQGPRQLMTASIQVGERRLPDATSAAVARAADTLAAWHVYHALDGEETRATGAAADQTVVLTGSGALLGTPVHDQIVNGRFDTADPADDAYGWASTGQAGAQAGQGVLREDERLASRLAQTFIVPVGAQTLRFEIVAIDFVANDGGPSDAFEVALLDSRGAPVAGTTSLTNSDALFNLQADGRVWTASAVSVTSLTGHEGGVLNGSRPVTVSIDMTGIPAGIPITLYFDLLGLGTAKSTVV